MALNGFIKGAAREPGQCARSRRNAQQVATAPKALNPISGQQISIEEFASGSLPDYGNTGRIVWAPDNSHIYIDTGSGWKSVELTG